MHCAPPTICTPKLYASHNFESYEIHDAKKQRFYWLILDGYKVGIYSLESAAKDQLPPEGRFKIVRCQSIAEAVYYWRDYCKENHAFNCDATERELARQKMAKERAKLHPSEMMPDSDDEAPLPRTLTPPVRVVELVLGPGPDPTCRRPMCPGIFPLDDKAAKRFQLKADAPESPPRSRRRHVPAILSPSPEPKVPLYREDEDDQPAHLTTSACSSPSSTAVATANSCLSPSISSASSLSASTNSAVSAVQLRPVLESASTPRSTKQILVSSALPFKAKFKPAVAASQQVNERIAARSTPGSRSASGLCSGPTPRASISARAPLRGPFYFNPKKQTIYRHLETGLGKMRRRDKLVVVKTARAMAKIIDGGGLLENVEVIEISDDSEVEVIEISNNSDVEIA
ncbi:hypothetical protein MSAN_00848000 [Mycena sanguinolenta]|uniref:Uncharacterized protein n=1 Tax=Mycena sanguinolenta TaxID=230812 RepID=A0A8H6Z0X0_9AGAR|nr:hypothetical protein MSAN_00848000 [Mycena sanguinolenta]